MGRVTDRRTVQRLRDGVLRAARPDALVVEEPLEVRVDGQPLAVTMRTPGSDIELALGFLVSEGVVRSAKDVVEARFCGDVSTGREENVVEVVLSDEAAEAMSSHVHHLARNVTVTSACGICGRTSIDAVRTTSPYAMADDPVSVTAARLTAMAADMRSAQQVFDRTGGLHAVAVFEPDGRLVALREDVGRHNAFDKVVGGALQHDRLPMRAQVALVSGRASFELVQKAALAGIPVLAAVSAPSTLAVDLAHDTGITLVGFLRGESMNVYTHPRRVTV